MIHTSHGLRIYRKGLHVLVVFGILILPIAFIFFGGWVSHISARDLGTALSVSGYRLFVAYLLSAVIALFLAITLGQGKIGDFFIPVFDLLQNLPSFALIPVFAILWGYTNTMAIGFAVSAMIWPILFYVLSAIRTAKTDFNEAATVFGATGWRRFSSYLLPLSFPALVTGSIVSVSIGWEAVIGVEIIGFSNGIGNFLNANAGANGNHVLIFGLITLLLIVFSINKLVWLPLLKRSQLYAE